VFDGTTWNLARPTVRAPAGWSATSSSDSLTVTTGNVFKTAQYQPSYDYYGYNDIMDADPNLIAFSTSLPGNIGSVSKTYVTVADEAYVKSLYWVSGGAGYQVIFSFANVYDKNVVYANEGFTSITIGSTTFNRVDATFSQSSGTVKWTWTATATNVFGTAGSTRTVTWA
jgi:hypothetical protein